MTLLDLFRRQPAFTDDPAASDTDWDRPCQAERKLATLYRTGEIEDGEIGPGVLETHWAARPLRWTTTPPRPGWYWCRFVGDTSVQAIHVEAGYDYGVGRIEWAGPIQVPPP